MSKRVALLGTEDDCDGAVIDTSKCDSKMPQGAALMKCVKISGDTVKVSCAEKACDDWVQCIVKEFCSGIEKAKNPQGCADYAKKEFFDKMFDKDCKAECKIFPMMLVIVVVVVLLLVAAVAYCYCKKKCCFKAAAEAPKSSGAGL